MHPKITRTRLNFRLDTFVLEKKRNVQSVSAGVLKTKQALISSYHNLMVSTKKKKNKTKDWLLKKLNLVLNFDLASS